MKKYVLLAAILLFACSGAFGAGLVEPDGYKRVRVAECFNLPAAQLLLIKLDAAFRNTGVLPPAWRTLESKTAGDYEKLDDVMVISAQDMLITGNEEYAEKL